MTLISVAAALCTGASFFLVALWFTRFGTALSATEDRLSRLRSADLPGAPGISGTLLDSVLRKKGKSDATESFLQKYAKSWEGDLGRAGLTLNVREYLVLRLAVGLALSALALMFLPVPMVWLVGLPLGFFGVGRWTGMRISARKRKLDTQLIEVLQTMASGLRAGFGLLQALEAAAEQSMEPLSVELRRTLRDIAVGSSVEQALAALNERVNSSDFDIVISAVLIQRSVGGNLAEILDNVAHTMRERERIRGEIRALTSQQRLTGFVIGGIPIALLGGFTLLNPDYVGSLYTEPVGNVMLVVAGAFEFFGFLVIRKIINIEI